MDFSSIAYIEFYVANSLQSAHFYKNMMGFRICNVILNEEKYISKKSYLMNQGRINLIFTSSLHPNNNIAHEVHLHGDGVKDIAFYVEDVSRAFTQALKLNAKSILEPTKILDVFGEYEKATVSMFGDTTHSFVKLKTSETKLSDNNNNCKNITGMSHIDHIAIVLEKGSLEKLVSFYQNLFNYQVTYKQIVDTNEGGGMNSIVVSSPCKNVQITLIEPKEKDAKSQINNFISNYHGSGVQHIAFATNSITKCVTKLKKRGLEFLKIPEGYYLNLRDELSINDDELELYKRNQILVDEENSGLLLQIFSKPLHPRRTLFIELIERRAAYGFGNKNVVALFQAIEQEQTRGIQL